MDPVGVAEQREHAVAEGADEGPYSGGGTVEHRTRPYWLLDAMLAYRFDEHVSAALNIDNLLDKRYYTIFDVYSTYTWGEPRSVRASVTYRF